MEEKIYKLYSPVFQYSKAVIYLKTNITNREHVIFLRIQFRTFPKIVFLRGQIYVFIRHAESYASYRDTHRSTIQRIHMTSGKRILEQTYKRTIFANYSFQAIIVLTDRSSNVESWRVAIELFSVMSRWKEFWITA